MSTKAKRILLILGGIFLTLSLVLAGTWFARITILQRISESVLHSQGFENSSLNIKTADFQSLVIQDVNIGSVIRADNMTVTYELAKLLNGAVEGVSIDKLFVDISDPTDPVYNRLRALAEQDAETSEPTAFVPPEITIKKFKISETRTERSALIEGSAALSSGGDLELQATASLQLRTPSGDISLNNASVRALGSLKTNIFKITLIDALLQQGGDNPQFSPLQIMAEGEIQGTKALATVKLKTSAGVDLIDLQSRFDIEEQAGNVSYKIAKLVFDRHGLQPSHLLPALNALPSISAVLSGQGEVTLQGDDITLEAETALSDVSVMSKDFSFSAPKIENRSRLQILTTGAVSQLEGETTAASLTASAANENIGVSDVIVSITGKDQNDLTAKLDGFIESRQKKKSFPKLRALLTAKKNNDNITLKGSLVGFSKELNIQLNAAHSIISQQGSANVTIPAFKIGAKDTKLSEISSYLNQIEGDVSAEVRSNINAAWESDFNPVFKLSGQLKNASFQKESLVITAGAAEIETTEFKLNDPLSVQIKNFSGLINAEGRKLALSAPVITLDVHKNYTGTDIIAPAVTVKPMERAVLKPDIVLAVQGKTDFQDIRADIRASSQLLGQFASVDGAYNILRKRGDVTIETIKIPFDPEGLTLADLLQDPREDLKLSGAVAAKLSIKIQDSLIDGSGTLDIDNLSIDQEGTRLDALNGVLELEGLNPLRTAPMQRLQADGITAGINVGNPTLQFSIDQVNNKPILKIHRMIMNLFGGAAEIKDEVIDPFAKSNRLKVHLTSLSIEELVALGDLEEVVASGSLRGIIPLEFDGDKLVIPDAVLEAEGPGILSVKSQAARQALASGGSQTKLLFDVLENFNYSALSLKIKKPASGEDVITLHTKGANPNVENNRPVVLNVNLSTNLDRIFNTILEGYRLSEQALRATLKGRK